MIDPSVPVVTPAEGRSISAYVPVMELRAMQVRRDGPALVRIAGHVLLLVLGGFLVAAAEGSAWIVPAWIFDGYVIVHLFALLHECSHRTAFKSGYLNTLVASVCGYALAQPPLHFRREHIAHHGYTQDRERDPQLIPLPPTFGLYLLFLSGIPFWGYTLRSIGAHCVGRLCGGEAGYLRSRADRTTVFREARLVVLVYLVAIVASVLAHSDAFFVYWLIPRVLGEPAMRAYRIAEHAGRPVVRDITLNTRTFRTWGLVRFLDYNMNFHAEHHAAPSVPFHGLPRLHERFGPFVEWADGGVLAAHRDIIGRIRAGRRAGTASRPA